MWRACLVPVLLILLSSALAIAGCASDEHEQPQCKSGRADREPRCSEPDPEGIECPPCAANEQCVVFFDGVCSQIGEASCVPTECHECSAECDRALCGGGDPVNAPQTFTCMAEPCVDLPADAIGCYGP
jgi:hypothetical protein